MTSIIRIQPLRRATNLTIPLIHRVPISHSPWRRYAHSSYGGEGEQKSQGPGNNPTRNIEHPGPPPPDVGQKSSSSSSQSTASTPKSSAPKEPEPAEERPIETTPSNNARPTLSDARQSPNVDENGNPRPDVPEDVKQHNAEVENRYDRSYNQIADEGKIQRGSWTGNS
ncbi:hypothetical protein ASPWEDRAFT_169033 [Aspergillus wentii DTO 134E9]|uniref:Uncharacterized protein n=1 Tax=Aspergillus wentii DTO 134E9 TaxID=1073089 RepID=A0A1L9RWB8_ASPWE|nr:uncharacterized protein ASPWEDRAFT_169033 [Aspergillus wentii DTO 134E9]KAI9929129.1 hypothetical protein MW887_001533 [Aspergillus wentii]OJJ39174.1 hypothetical protein ASPWEDRAFT_169033 [Aspergillus wentii DTO 134E9]